MNKKILAFTLIELLVVIAIIGILSGLIVVTMNGVTTKANIAKSQVFSNSLRNALMLNLVSEWKFDNGITGSGITVGNVIDSWGSNNATSIGGSPTVIEDCIYGKCLYFDGNDYVNFGDTSDMDSITVSAWVKTGSFLPEDWGTIIEKGNQTANNHFWLCYRTTGFMFEFGNGTVRDKSFYPISFSLNEWYYVVGTYTSGSGYVYVNGNKGNHQTAITGNLAANDFYLLVGRYRTDNYYWVGMIDDVRMFNSVVSESKVKEMYYSGLNQLFAKEQIIKEEYIFRVSELAQR